MKTVEIKLYQFEELPKDAQDKAIQNYSDINIDHDWWEFIYEDAANIGLHLNGFDLDRANYCKGEFISSAFEVIELIKREHGESCETYHTAQRYSLTKPSDIDAEDYEEWQSSFLADLLNDYLNILRKEYEYLTSDEAIKETLIANEYDFTENGKIYK